MTRIESPRSSRTRRGSERFQGGGGVDLGVQGNSVGVQEVEKHFQFDAEVQPVFLFTKIPRQTLSSQQNKTYKTSEPTSF